MPSEIADAKLPRVLGPAAALCTIVGSVIGSGIFIVPARVAHEIPAMGPIVIAWVVGGLYGLAGVLTLSELSAMLPRAGGPYVYLRAAYGKLPAFLFGWTEFLIIRSGSMATLAAAFSLYAAQLIRAPSGWEPLVWQSTLAVAALAVVAVVNVLGTRWGGAVQVVGTILKVGALLAMMVAPFVLGRVDVRNWSPAWPSGFDGKTYQHFLVAMVAVLWAYDGWVNTSNLAEEIRDPRRTLPRALIGGMIILIAIYVGMTLVYHLVLPMEVIASASTERGSPRAVSADFCRHLLGDAGLVAIALVVMTSTFISLNGNVLAGPRAYFALARDGLFPHGLAAIHPRFQTPARAIIAQTIWAALLAVAGSALILVPPPSTDSGLPGWLLEGWAVLNKTALYEVLYEYVIFGATIFYTLAIASVFVLRWRRPDLERPYRTWGYPVTPLLFMAGAGVLLANMLTVQLAQSLAGLGVIALGLPAYLVLARRPTDTTAAVAAANIEGGTR